MSTGHVEPICCESFCSFISSFAHLFRHSGSSIGSTAVALQTRQHSFAVKGVPHVRSKVRTVSVSAVRHHWVALLQCCSGIIPLPCWWCSVQNYKCKHIEVRNPKRPKYNKPPPLPPLNQSFGSCLLPKFFTK